MKHFWALPALLRLALASTHSSVLEDILAYPQYQVLLSEDYVTESDADYRLSGAYSFSDSSDVSHREPYIDTSDFTDGAKSTPEASPPVYEHMWQKGQRYLCSIPQVVKPAADTNKTAVPSPEEEALEFTRASERGWELLKGMEGNCIYFASGWWSYSFCHKRGVRQFHQLPPSRTVPIYPPVEDPNVNSFVLGDFKSIGSGREEGDEQDKEQGEAREESGVARLETKGEQRYLVQNMAGGTTCDLTGKDRRIEIQFHCHAHSHDRIHLIKETSTCAYLMVIYTPRLCNDVAFQLPKKAVPNTISCSPILSESEIPHFETIIAQRKEAQQAKEKQEAKRFADYAFQAELADGMGAEFIPLPSHLDPQSIDYDPPQQVVGGVVIGAQKYVGAPGKKIEKSAIVGGGKETFIGTVATSDGTKLSAEELKKLSIKDPKDVERFQREMEKMANGRGWRLDVVDTPRGREYRGIVDDEDEAKGTMPSPDDDQGEDGIAADSKAKKTNQERPERQDAKKDVEKDEENETEGSKEEMFKEEL